ncbi:Transposon Ty3-I Gag-Pol polyprotein [Araneus ventricosus]|uniref:Transposon Ty3-I Gag-Pol polyprotein n=1 Tax=Araneus ventricosus TaxID=182803 RepID=A0A4Y2EWU8_ARAVE|nr:Transposon Ty3-I Gag-Pol polyprotein [Araneus ventricosus]
MRYCSTQEQAERLVKEMVDNRIVEESSGPWTSSIVLVKKKEGSTRFCVSYRKLNEMTIKDSYPLPRIDDTLDAFNGSQWFSTLDLKSSYWEPEGQIARWIQRLQEYDFEIQNRKGTSHGNADALSRRPCKRAANIARMQRKCSEWKQTFQ